LKENIMAETTSQNEIENVIIIGSGPAGHTAAVYAARADLNPLMFEGFMAGGVAAGGQLTTTTDVENYPGFPEGIMGPALMDDMRKQSQRFGTRIKTETVDAVDLSARPFTVTVGKKEYRTQTVIIATGATAKRLGLPGEEDYWQRGMSACAVCDGALPLFRDKPLVVIGGGDSACEEASYLTKFGSKVYMLVRRDELRASKAMQKRVTENEKIDILWNTNATSVSGDGKLLTTVSVKNNVTGEERDIAASGLFYAIGHVPNTSFLNGQLPMDETGYLLTEGKSTATSVPGVFACGDVQDKIYRQAVTAAGSGCMAALEAERFIVDGE
jgi:thioredoxin reductase (NADPH)